MKNIPLIIGAILFSILFNKQNLGLNLSLFSIITTIILLINNQSVFKLKSTKAYSILYLITAIAVFVYNNNLALIANIVCYFTLIGHVSEHKSSIYLNWINGLYSSFVGYVHRNFKNKDGTNKTTLKKEIDYFHLAKIIGIPFAVLIIFIGLYKNGNPMFNGLINKIDLSFINIQWLLVAMVGYYLLSNISKPVIVDSTTIKDINTNNLLAKPNNLGVDKLKKEHQLGFVLILLLNLLILLFLITDITYLITENDFRASSFSNQVHSGINALIASIIIAIAIILYFFRGDLNFYKDNKNLKTVAYIWMLLNAILVINIIIKDCQYIYFFGLTYKRIGVLVYLLLTTIGLITTSIKIKNIKNFWYLLRINTLTAFTILVVSCTVNWDSCITIYNLNYAQSMDFNYLINLSNNNTFILKNYIDNNDLNIKSKRAVQQKFNKYIYLLKQKNWQEIQFDNLKLIKTND
ncbi:hypothetical protein GCM10022291_28010 [Postechiella marina]|uniref:DUF4173 domain-containing protein n=1 Tax=Postechiella marina TaxID=943941 RepID=A0ABP8CEK3_9FLAO